MHLHFLELAIFLLRPRLWKVPTNWNSGVNFVSKTKLLSAWWCWDRASRLHLRLMNKNAHKNELDGGVPLLVLIIIQFPCKIPNSARRHQVKIVTQHQSPPLAYQGCQILILDCATARERYIRALYWETHLKFPEIHLGRRCEDM